MVIARHFETMHKGIQTFMKNSLKNLVIRKIGKENGESKAEKMVTSANKNS